MTERFPAIDEISRVDVTDKNKIPEQEKDHQNSAEEEV